MKIGLITIEAGVSIVNQLTYEIVKKNLHKHKFYRFDEKETIRPFGEEDLYNWKKLGGNLLRSISLEDAQKLNKIQVSSLDGVVVMGGEEALRFSKQLRDINNIKILFIPVSIYNEIPESPRSLGYDSALNAAIEDIFKVEDTVSSCRYDQFRLFGIQLPGKPGSLLEKDVADAAGDVIRYLDVDSPDRLSHILREKIDAGLNHSLLIFDDMTELTRLEELIEATQLDLSWKITQINEAQCSGMHPTASDRILANKIADVLIQWVEGEKNSGLLILQDNKVTFKNN
ncbi:6-phosphofructokinase 1 [Evansella vedderi]|uniref:6-phosphofructokinase 1 n=1 Tax=Evansella vedderi TaxID=38282 RepID=A0ABT9ZZM4_9BACI|nr:6-phosphofructokinase [Evansella vedderi]MDQ0256698.1 6-phosphofructokinase 1 [Evansella vedderi]